MPKGIKGFQKAHWMWLEYRWLRKRVEAEQSSIEYIAQEVLEHRHRLDELQMKLAVFEESIEETLREKK